MAATFCGFPLSLLTDDYRQFINQFHSFTDFSESDLWGYSGYGLSHLPLPSVPLPEPPRVGTLVWPTELTRCTYCHCLIHSTNLADIRTALGAGSAGPADLVLTDGTGNIRTFSLRLLCARPLSQITGNGQVFLCTLVDSRWYLRQRTGSIESVPASWGDLLNDLASQLGITLTVDSIDSDYGVPSDRWVFFDKPLSPVLDAVCTVIGHRLVANLDGTFSTQNYETAVDAAGLQTEALVKTAGGLLVQTDLVRSVAASVDVHFPKTVGGAYQSDPHTVTVTLAVLAISEYGTATGVAGQVETINGEVVYDGTNSAAATAYAEQAATDYYRWQLVDLDLTYPAVTQWTPTGAEDRVEWSYQIGRVLTRVVRGPLQTLTGGGFEAGPNSTGGPTAGHPEPLTRVTAVATGGGEFSRRYTVKVVQITDTAGSLNAVDVSPTTTHSNVVELANSVVPVSIDADPLQGIYPLHTSPNGQKYIIADEADYFPSGSGMTSGSGDDFTGSPRRLVYYDEKVQCEEGWLSVYKFPIYQFGNGLIQAAEEEIEWDRIEGCCDCNSGPHTPSGSGSGPSCIEACPQCPDGTSSTLKFTITTVGACNLLYMSSGLKTLYYDPVVGNQCRWSSVIGDETWELYFDTEDEQWLLVAGSGILIYAIDAVDWNCDGGNTLTLVSAECVGADETVTITRVGNPCVVVVGGCPDGHIYTVATFSNKTGACTCFPASITRAGGALGSCGSGQWVTITCEGTTTLDLCCIGSEWALHAIGVGYCTLVSYVAGTIVFDSPVLNCAGASDGTVRITLT